MLLLNGIAFYVPKVVWWRYVKIGTGASDAKSLYDIVSELCCVVMFLCPNVDMSKCWCVQIMVCLNVDVSEGRCVRIAMCLNGDKSGHVLSGYVLYGDEQSDDQQMDGETILCLLQ